MHVAWRTSCTSLVPKEVKHKRSRSKKVVNFVTTYRPSKLNRIIEDTSLVCLWMQKCIICSEPVLTGLVVLLKQTHHFLAILRSEMAVTVNLYSRTHYLWWKWQTSSPCSPGIGALSSSSLILRSLYMDASVLQILRFGWHCNSTGTFHSLSPSIITPIWMRLITLTHVIHHNFYSQAGNLQLKLQFKNGISLTQCHIWCCIYQSSNMQHSTSVMTIKW